MYRFINLMIITATVLVVPALVQGAKPQSASGPVAFLEHAAEGQQMEMALGQLAGQRAADEQVKQFGARMVEDHQKASEEIRALASKEGIALRAQPELNKQLTAKLSHLSGKEFDRAYMTFMLQDHTQNVKDFGQHALVGENTEVRQWAAGALPVLKEHLAKVKTIASSLGMATAATNKAPQD